METTEFSNAYGLKLPSLTLRDPASWQKKVAKRFASQLGTKPERIKIYPWNSKRDLTIAHQCLGSLVCPVNQRMYYAYWDLR